MVPLCVAQGVPIARGLLVYIAAWSLLHLSDRIHQGRIRTGVGILIGLARIGRRYHRARLGWVLLKAYVGDVRRVTLE